MTIEVKSVPEEYSYIMLHPHECGDGKEGEWETIGRQAKHQLEDDSMFSYDEFQVRCKLCGAESTFEFKLEQQMYRELKEAMEKSKKD